MSYQALRTAATGMEAALFQLDAVANNLANSSTTGFKRSRVNFEDVFYEHFKVPGAIDGNGQTTPLGISVGYGARVKSTQLDFQEGSLIQTGKQLDLAIAGEGFFQVQTPTGFAYTRDGSFTVNSEGNVVLASADRGRLLSPTITIPQDTTDISISGDGVVLIKQAGSDTQQQVGQLELVRFINPEGLLQMGENLYEITAASGQPIAAAPGQDGAGPVRQGFLESSNVEPVTELVDMIKTQRAVELNSQALQAGDQMLQLLVSLRRF